MPERRIRQNILTSDAVDKLDNAGENFYRRLMSVVDDYGLFDARPSVLRVSCFPLRVDRVREADISRWLAACEKAGLLALYEIDGKPYLVYLKLGEPRAQKPKFPPPTWFPQDVKETWLNRDKPPPARVCAQPRANAPPSPSPSPSPSPPPKPPMGGRRRGSAAEKREQELASRLEELKRKDSHAGNGTG